MQCFSTRTAVPCAYSTTYVVRQCELILTSNLKIPVHSLLLQYLIIKVFPSSHSLAVSLSSQSIFFVNFSQLCTIFSIFSKHSRQEAKEKTYQCGKTFKKNSGKIKKRKLKLNILEGARWLNFYSWFGFGREASVWFPYHICCLLIVFRDFKLFQNIHFNSVCNNIAHLLLLRDVFKETRVQSSLIRDI